MSTITSNQLTTAPSAPATGQVIRYFRNDIPYYMLDDGIEREYGTQIFGSCFDIETNQTYVTHNDNDPLYMYVDMDSTSCPAGKYRIGVTLSWNMSSTNVNFIARLIINGVTIGELSEETHDSGTDVRNWNSAFFYYDHAGGFLDVEIWAGPETAGYTARLYYGSVEKWRVQ